MERLREIDEIAYVRFASVYRSFKDVAEMRAEIEDFLAHPPRPGGCRPAGRARREDGGRSWLSTWASDRPRPPAGSGVHDPGSMVRCPRRSSPPWPMATRCWSPRAPGGMGTVRMSFCDRAARVVYLLTKRLLPQGPALGRAPLVRLTAPGSRLVAEAVVQR